MLHSVLSASEAGGAPAPATPAAAAADASGVSLATCIVVAIVVSAMSNVGLFVFLSKKGAAVNGGRGESMYSTSG